MHPTNNVGLIKEETYKLFPALKFVRQHCRERNCLKLAETWAISWSKDASAKGEAAIGGFQGCLRGKKFTGVRIVLTVGWNKVVERGF